MKIIYKILSLVVAISFIASCSHRGMQLGHQIPEFNENFNPEVAQVWAEGAERDKIVYGNLNDYDMIASQAAPQSVRSIASESQINYVPEALIPFIGKAAGKIPTSFGQRGLLVAQ